MTTESAAALPFQKPAFLYYIYVSVCSVHASDEHHNKYKHLPGAARELRLKALVLFSILLYGGLYGGLYERWDNRVLSSGATTRFSTWQVYHAKGTMFAYIVC